MLAFGSNNLIYFTGANFTLCMEWVNQEPFLLMTIDYSDPCGYKEA